MSDIEVHLSHCFQGEYSDSCKYGEDDCPADTKGALFERLHELHRAIAIVMKYQQPRMEFEDKSAITIIKDAYYDSMREFGWRWDSVDENFKRI